MKFTHSVAAGLLVLGLLVSGSAQDPVKFNIPGVTKEEAAKAAASSSTPSGPAAAPAGQKPAASKYTESEMMIAYGWFLGQRVGLAALDFSPSDIDAITKGIQMAAAGKPPPYEQDIGPELDAFLGKKNEVLMDKIRQQNRSAAAAFFSKLDENKGVTKLDDGLRYEILKPGTGAYPKVGQLAKVHYTGSFVNGQVFDSSVQRGQPAELVLQEPSEKDPRGVISGIVEGLQKINTGGKIKLYIPPHLAYGDSGTPGGIPPSAALIFEVELLDVKDAPKYTPPANETSGS